MKKIFDIENTRTTDSEGDLSSEGENEEISTKDSIKKNDSDNISGYYGMITRKLLCIWRVQ